ncbi:MAG TPA: hypothetical protein PK095_16255 [Myxococcota bacterium]|nr:hypothetical protein [Myxococcota bacterium]
MKLPPRLFSLVLATAAVGSTTSALAFLPKPKVSIPKVPKVPGAEENDRKQMSEINRMAQEGLRKVPSNFEGPLEKRAEGMAAAKALYDDCAARYKTVVDPSINEGAQRYWNEFKLAYEMGLPQLDITAKWEPITTLHAQNTPVLDGDLDQLDAAVAAFVKVAHKDYKRTADKWESIAKKLRSTNAEIAKNNAARAASDAAKMDLDRRNGLLKTLEETIKGMEATAKEDKAPVAAELWASLESTLKETDEISPKIRTAFEYLAFPYKVYDAWYQADAPTAVATALAGGKAFASGKLSTRENKVKVKVQANQCYGLFGRFHDRTGNEEVKDVSLVHGRNVGDVLPIYGGHGNRVTVFDGACPIKDVELTFDVELAFPGSSANYQWVLVSWPRNAFPVEVASRSEVWGPVPCSGPITESFFKNAVPGLFVWSGEGTPGLIKGVNQGSFQIRNVRNEESSIRIDRATVAWPEKKSLPSTEYRQSCSGHDDSEDPLVDKLAKCHRGIDKQFDPRFSAANKRRDNAITLGQHNAAVREIDSLKAQYSKALVKCEPLEKQVEKAMSESITRLNDWFLANKPATSEVPDVPRYLSDVYEGRRRFEK